MPHHGTAVLAAAVFYLQNILVRFVLALALRYLLTPLIGAIQYCRVPRGLAILLSFGAAVGGLVRPPRRPRDTRSRTRTRTKGL